MLQIVREISIPPRSPADPLKIELTLNYSQLRPGKLIQIILKDIYGDRPPVILEHYLGS